MDLSILIVNWNSREYLRRCIASVLAETHGIDFEIVVIDNASFDGCDAMLCQGYPQVRFVQSARNLGFARANNVAFGESCGRHLLFLNPDTEIEGGAILELLRGLESSPGAGIVGPRLLNSDRSVQTTCVRAFPDLLNQILDTDLLRRLFPRSRLWGMAPLFDGSGMPSRVDAISGACLMIKRRVFEEVGMFTTDYFMYSEDIDLCFKAERAGWETCYIPTATVVHHGGGSSSRSRVSAFSSVMMLESRWRFFRNTRSVWVGRLYRLAMGGSSAIRIGLILVSWPVFRGLGRDLPLEGVLEKWTARLRWALGGEKWVQELGR